MNPHDRKRLKSLRGKRRERRSIRVTGNFKEQTFSFKKALPKIGVYNVKKVFGNDIEEILYFLRERKIFGDYQEPSKFAEYEAVANLAYILRNNSGREDSAHKSLLKRFSGFTEEKLTGIGLESDVSKAWEKPRADAYLLNDEYAFPIEIKSELNRRVYNKSLRQIFWGRSYLSICEKEVHSGCTLENDPDEDNMTIHVIDLSGAVYNALGLQIPKALQTKVRKEEKSFGFSGRAEKRFMELNKFFNELDYEGNSIPSDYNAKGIEQTLISVA